MSTLWLPPERLKPPQPELNRSTRMITYHYDQTGEFKRLCEKRGAVYCGTVEVPFFNVWGDQVGTEYATIYVHHEDIEMAILT